MVNTSGLPEIASPGVLVRNADGRTGITVGWVKAAGPNKGRLPVMWEGMGYTLAEWPEDLKRADEWRA